MIIQFVAVILGLLALASLGLVDDTADLLNPRQIAKRLNISESMAYRLLQSGHLRPVRLGRAVRCRPETLEDFITACENNPTPQIEQGER